jgi:hypothetical protein
MRDRAVILRELLDEVEERIAEIQKQIQSLNLEQSQLRTERNGLRMSLGRVDTYIGQDDTAAAPEEERSTDQEIEGVVADGWQAQPRVWAVLHALTEMHRDVSPAELAAYLAEKGRADTANNVSAALAYWKARHQAWRVGHGQWTATAPEDTSTPALTGVDDVLDQDTRGGTESHEALLHDHDQDPPGRDGRDFNRPVITS